MNIDYNLIKKEYKNSTNKRKYLKDIIKKYQNSLNSDFIPILNNYRIFKKDDDNYSIIDYLVIYNKNLLKEYYKFNSVEKLYIYLIQNIGFYKDIGYFNNSYEILKNISKDISFFYIFFNPKYLNKYDYSNLSTDELNKIASLITIKKEFINSIYNYDLIDILKNQQSFLYNYITKNNNNINIDLKQALFNIYPFYSTMLNIYDEDILQKIIERNSGKIWSDNNTRLTNFFKMIPKYYISDKIIEKLLDNDIIYKYYKKRLLQIFNNESKNENIYNIVFRLIIDKKLFIGNSSFNYEYKNQIKTAIINFKPENLHRTMLLFLIPMETQYPKSINNKPCEIEIYKVLKALLKYFNDYYNNIDDKNKFILLKCRNSINALIKDFKHYESISKETIDQHLNDITMIMPLLNNDQLDKIIEYAQKLKSNNKNINIDIN